VDHHKQTPKVEVLDHACHGFVVTKSSLMATKHFVEAKSWAKKLVRVAIEVVEAVNEVGAME
jgi:hypothetical protein